VAGIIGLTLASSQCYFGLSSKETSPAFTLARHSVGRLPYRWSISTPIYLCLIPFLSLRFPLPGAAGGYSLTRITEWNDRTIARWPISAPIAVSSSGFQTYGFAFVTSLCRIVSPVGV